MLFGIGIDVKPDRSLLPEGASLHHHGEVKTLGERLRFAMDRIGVPPRGQNEFGRRAGVGGPALSLLLNDKRKRPNIVHVSCLASALGVSFEWLATGQGDPGYREQVFPDPTRNVFEAADIARRSGMIDPEAIRQVVAEDDPSTPDRSTLEWIDIIRVRDITLRSANTASKQRPT